MRRFYWQQIEKSGALITGREAKHISRVLRMQPGDMLILFDGSGMEYICEITQSGTESVGVRIIEKQESDAQIPVRITLFQAVIKSDHLDYAVQKCTEIGVNAFVPILSKRCVRRPDEKSAARLVEREQRIAMEAAKQCGRASIPHVSKIITLEEAAADLKMYEGLKLAAFENERKTSLKKILRENVERDIALFVGPEGGFAEEEIRLLTDAGTETCTLGRLILRSETAGVAAAAMIAYEFMEN